MKQRENLPNHEAWTSVKYKNSASSRFFRPLKAGITMVGNATLMPRSNSKKFFAVLASTCGKMRLNLLTSGLSSSSASKTVFESVLICLLVTAYEVLLEWEREKIPSNLLRFTLALEPKSFKCFKSLPHCDALNMFFASLRSPSCVLRLSGFNCACNVTNCGRCAHFNDGETIIEASLSVFFRCIRGGVFIGRVSVKL